jgi:ubiquinol oxidase
MQNVEMGPIDLSVHHEPENLSDRFAYGFVKVLRFFADTFFAKRYGHRAIVLETVAAVPGMVAGSLQHLRSLRRMEDDNGMIRTLLDEAENERMHLMTFIKIAKPNKLERFIILITQGIFYNAFFLFYLIAPRSAHRVVGYFEEEAVIRPAPQVAIDYWNLPKDARLRDVILVIRDDEAGHRDVNHSFADLLA